MTDMLKDGAEWLADQRRAFMSRTVTYERGTDLVELPATVGQTDFSLTDDYGAAIRYVSRNFLIAVSDLVINGSMTEPKRGDRIRETVGDVTYVHEVMGPSASGGSEQDWRYSDPQRTTFRVYTKQIDQEPAP